MQDADRQSGVEMAVLAASSHGSDKKKVVEWLDKTLGLWGSEIRGVFSAAQTAQGRPGRRHAENCVSAGVRLGAAIQP